MPPRVSATRAVSLALLALLLPGDSSPGPRSVEASAVATDDACFYDVASGTCVASAVWVTGQHGLLRTPRANLLADVVAGIETCASAFGDAEACARHAGTCDYDATFIPNENGGFESVGGCFPTLSWATALAERCLAHVSDADATVSALLATAAACVARAESRERCAADAKCAWTETDADGDVVQGFCAPDPLAAAVTALGASGVGALVAAKTACEGIILETPCDSDPSCEWRGASRAEARGGRRRTLDEDDDASSSGTCAANVAHVLVRAVDSPALKAYLERVERCAAGRESAAACASAAAVTKTRAGFCDCAWGRRSASTNVIPRAYDGDGGDGSGGWVFSCVSEGSEDTEEKAVPSDMSCFPTYASIADAVAPTLGVAAGACGSLAPLLDAAEACAAAGRDRGACAAAGACSYASTITDAESRDGGRCELDASAAMEALLSGGDAAVFRAMRAACAAGEKNATACARAGAEAASAGIEAAGDGNTSSSGSRREPSRETSSLSYFVLFCFFFFALFVAPPVAYANVLKNRGEDVCDALPPWARAYVPAALRPPTSRYEAFVGQETGDDL
jgi:hypothetical protein